MLDHPDLPTKRLRNLIPYSERVRINDLRFDDPLDRIRWIAQIDRSRELIRWETASLERSVRLEHHRRFV